MMNLDFSFYNWDLVTAFLLKGFYFSVFLTFVSTLGGIAAFRTPESAAELASDVSVAFMWVLERLSPEERADRLFNRVMRLSSEGKADSAAFFEAAGRVRLGQDPGVALF